MKRLSRSHWGIKRRTEKSSLLNFAHAETLEKEKRGRTNGVDRKKKIIGMATRAYRLKLLPIWIFFFSLSSFFSLLIIMSLKVYSKEISILKLVHYLNRDDFSFVLGQCKLKGLMHRQLRSMILFQNFWRICQGRWQFWRFLASSITLTEWYSIWIEDKLTWTVYVKICWQEGWMMCQMLIKLRKGVLQLQYSSENWILQKSG